MMRFFARFARGRLAVRPCSPHVLGRALPSRLHPIILTVKASAPSPEVSGRVAFRTGGFSTRVELPSPVCANRHDRRRDVVRALRFSSLFSKIAPSRTRSSVPPGKFPSCIRVSGSWRRPLISSIWTACARRSLAWRAMRKTGRPGICAGDPTWATPCIPRHVACISNTSMKRCSGKHRQRLHSLKDRPGPGDTYDKPYSELKAYLLTTSYPQNGRVNFQSPVLLVTGWVAGGWNRSGPCPQAV